MRRKILLYGCFATLAVLLVPAPMPAQVEGAAGAGLSGAGTVSGVMEAAETAPGAEAVEPAAWALDLDPYETTFTGEEDECETRVGLACGETVSGSTVGGTPDDNPSCAAFQDQPPTSYYSITGNGGLITASLCPDAGGFADYDSALDVYTGTCDGLACVTGNDDFCGLQSEVSWASTLDEEYIVKVAGFSSSAGNYTLAINCACDGVALEGPAKVTAGEKFNLDIVCANADSAVFIAAGRENTTSARFVPGCGVVEFDLGPRANNFGTTLADGNGNATSSQTLGDNFANKTIYYQVVDGSKCTVSNVLAVNINPAG